jgi:predicted TIM-barrel fold metal-dependent hydrolase
VRVSGACRTAPSPSLASNSPDSTSAGTRKGEATPEHLSAADGLWHTTVRSVVVDIHTHFMNARTDCTPQVFEDLRRCNIDPALWEFTPEDHLRATDAADVAVVFGLRAARTGWHVPNDSVAEHVRRAPERLIFFAAIDPGEDGFIAELERCHQGLGAAGVKLGPVYQGVHPLGEECREVYAYCQRHGLPVVSHMATTFSSGVPLDYARPMHMDHVACEYPELKIVLAHMGHPWEAEAIAAVRKQPHLYADISALYYRPWQFYNAMRLAAEYGAGAKLLFGSDFPATTTEESMRGVRNINAVLGQSGLPPVPETLLDEIIHRDSLSLLGLSPPSTTEPGR